MQQIAVIHCYDGMFAEGRFERAIRPKLHLSARKCNFHSTNAKQNTIKIAPNTQQSN